MSRVVLNCAYFVSAFTLTLVGCDTDEPGAGGGSSHVNVEREEGPPSDSEGQPQPIDPKPRVNSVVPRAEEPYQPQEKPQPVALNTPAPDTASEEGSSSASNTSKPDPQPQEAAPRPLKTLGVDHEYFSLDEPDREAALRAALEKTVRLYGRIDAICRQVAVMQMHADLKHQRDREWLKKEIMARPDRLQSQPLLTFKVNEDELHLGMYVHVLDGGRHIGPIPVKNQLQAAARWFWSIERIRDRWRCDVDEVSEKDGKLHLDKARTVFTGLEKKCGGREQIAKIHGQPSLEALEVFSTLITSPGVLGDWTRKSDEAYSAALEYLYDPPKRSVRRPAFIRIDYASKTPLQQANAARVNELLRLVASTMESEFSQVGDPKWRRFPDYFEKAENILPKDKRIAEWKAVAASKLSEVVTQVVDDARNTRSLRSSIVRDWVNQLAKLDPQHPLVVDYRVKFPKR